MKRHSKKTGIKNIQTLLKNRNVLYVVLFLSVANLFSYLMLKQLDAVAFFIIIGFLTTYFSKNMIIVMLTSMVSTFLLVQINLLGNRQEGFEGEAGASASEAGAGAETGAETGASEAGAGEASAPPDAVDGGVHISKEQRAKITAMKDTPVATPPKKEKFTQKLNPARYNDNDDDDEIKSRHKPKVDYSATLETAYDNLDKLLNSDGIKNMSADTGRLAEKQKLLMGNIEKLTPIMEKASSVLNSMDIGGITGLMGGIQSRLKGFGKKDPVDEAAE
jgi:hypothetical protein